MMPTRRGCGLLKGAAGVAGIAVLAGAGYRLTMGECPLGLFDCEKGKDAVVTAVSLDSGGETARSCCAAEKRPATTEEAFFLPGPGECAPDEGCEMKVTDGCPASTEAESDAAKTASK